MFKELSNKLEVVFKKLRGQVVLTEKHIEEAMREVRRALLEADVNFKVAKEFISNVEVKAKGTDVLKNVAPWQQVIKIVNDELAALMGGTARELNISTSIPAKIMLVGLQGSGKTTTSGKLALMLRNKGKNPLLIACDLKRPAAIEQLKVIGKSLNISVYSESTDDVLTLTKNAIEFAKTNNNDICIFDTAGRLHVDEDLMEEVSKIKSTINPDEILFVTDAMTGQDAVNTAKAFYDKVSFTGVVLTKMDGDARGGAALSIVSVTGVPIKLVGTSEKMDGLEPFYPDRIASRILGMGDIVSLVEKAQTTITQEDADDIERKMRRNEFTLEDFLTQLRQIKKMGPLKDILGMLPGMNQIKDSQVDEGALTRIEAIVSSMTKQERRKPVIIDGSRRKRISKGSGTTVQDVNKLLKQFEEMQKMFKMFRKSPGKLAKMAGSLPF